MNIFFSFTVIISILVSLLTRSATLLLDEMLEAAQMALQLAIDLAGPIALFVGILKIGEAAGLLNILSRLMRPLMIRLFPSVPTMHPASGAMMLNFSASILGLGNAATPFGIKAMEELATLNKGPKDTATPAMTLFLAINTANITLVPTSIIAIRKAANSLDPAKIITSTLFASTLATITAIVVAKILCKEKVKFDRGMIMFSLLLAVFLAVMVKLGEQINPYLLPGLICALFLLACFRKVNIYLAFIQGARDGLKVIVNILPYLLAILFAFRMLKGAGLFELLTKFLAPYTSPWGLPAQALPLVLMRPFSGAGAKAIVADLLKDPSIGPDSYTGLLISTMMGSTETTFYILAVYCGAVGIIKMRNALLAALRADFVSVIGSVIAVKYIL